MTWGQPLALLGLLALPLVWWLHKKLRRPPEVVMPSLMFLQDEDDASALPSGRRFDAELLLALGAATLLTLAAAGPAFTQSEPRRVVRVVIDTRITRPDARGYARRVLATRQAMAAVLDPNDDLIVTAVPAAGEAASALRPQPGQLLSAARAGEASVRFVISDDGPPAETGGVHWIGVGDPAVVNQGIVALHAQVEDDATVIFCTVANYGSAALTVALQAGWVAPDRVAETTGPALRVPPDGMASQTLKLDAVVGRVTVRLVRPGGGAHEDAMPQDDAVVLQRGGLTVHFADVPAEHRRHVELALQATLGAGGYRAVPRDLAAGADLQVVRRGAETAHRGWTLELEAVPEGAPAERAPPGTDALGQHPLVVDLSTAGIDWVYAQGAAEPSDGERALLARSAGRRSWPVVLLRDRTVRLAPDPLRGEPRVFDTAFWPLFVENLVVAALGEGVGAGYRAQGILDAGSSRPGRARIPFEPAVIRNTPASMPGSARPLRPLLILGALACLALLWAAPRIRRRLTPKPALGAPLGT